MSRKIAIGHHNQSKKKHNDGNFVNPMHHAQIDIGWLIWIPLFENVHKITKGLA
jgi:hypothetical protein